MMTLGQALALFLIGPTGQSIDAPSREHLLDAAREAARWRREGPIAHGLIIQELHNRGTSYREIEEYTGTDQATAQRLVARLERET